MTAVPLPGFRYIWMGNVDHKFYRTRNIANTCLLACLRARAAIKKCFPYITRVASTRYIRCRTPYPSSRALGSRTKEPVAEGRAEGTILHSRVVVHRFPSPTTYIHISILMYTNKEAIRANRLGGSLEAERRQWGTVYRPDAVTSGASRDALLFRQRAIVEVSYVNEWRMMLDFV